MREAHVTAKPQTVGLVVDVDLGREGGREESKEAGSITCVYVNDPSVCVCVCVRAASDYG